MVKKLKDLGGKKWEKYPSIKAAQKAGSIYYGKKLKSGKVKKMAAVLNTDLGKGQSLNSFMNEQLKGSIKKIRPKLRPKPNEKISRLPKSGSRVNKEVDTKIILSGLPKSGPRVNGLIKPKNKQMKTLADFAQPINAVVVSTLNNSKGPVAKNQKLMTNPERKNLKPKLAFVKTLSKEAREDSTDAARYVSFSKVEKKLVKTLFQEGLTFKQAVAQVHGGRGIPRITKRLNSHLRKDKGK